MPPLIVAILLGAGAYAGVRAAHRLWSRVLETPVPVQARDKADAARVKDLGSLELDPITGVYRPRRD